METKKLAELYDRALEGSWRMHCHWQHAPVETHTVWAFLQTQGIRKPMMLGWSLGQEVVVARKALQEVIAR